MKTGKNACILSYMTVIPKNYFACAVDFYSIKMAIISYLGIARKSTTMIYTDIYAVLPNFP